MHAENESVQNAHAMALLGKTGAKVVFCAASASGRDGLFLADGDGLHVLDAPLQGDCRTPMLSPDGRFVVFSQDDGPGAGLCVADLDGDTEVLALSGMADYAPVWSQDGKWLAWCRCPAMNLESANHAEIWASPWPVFDPRPLTSNARMDCYPVFSPCGREIYFESGYADGLFGLFCVTLEGGESPILYEPGVSGNGIPHVAGDRIVFERAMAQTSALYDVYSLKRDEPETLTRHTFFEKHVNPTPRYSPDGSLIAYHMPEGEDCQVHLIDPERPEALPRRIAVEQGWLCYPRFDRSGKLVACQDYRHANLRIADAATGVTAGLSGPGPLRVTRLLELYNHDIA